MMMTVCEANSRDEVASLCRHRTHARAHFLDDDERQGHGIMVQSSV